MNSRTRTRPYDAAIYPRSEEECALYLRVVTEEANGDAVLIDAALTEIARARSRIRPAGKKPPSKTAA